MLTKDIWLEHEPRFAFPLFKNIKTLVSFSIGSKFKPLDSLGIAKLAKSTVTLGMKGGLKQTFRETLNVATEYAPVVFSSDGKRLKFRVVVTARDGKLLGVY